MERYRKLEFGSYTVSRKKWPPPLNISKFFSKIKNFIELSFNSINKHSILIKRRIFKIICLTIIEILAIINWYLKIAVSTMLLTDVSIAHSDINIDALFTLSKQHGYQ